MERYLKLKTSRTEEALVVMAVVVVVVVVVNTHRSTTWAPVGLEVLSVWVGRRWTEVWERDGIRVGAMGTLGSSRCTGKRRWDFGGLISLSRDVWTVLIPILAMISV